MGNNNEKERNSHQGSLQSKGKKAVEGKHLLRLLTSRISPRKKANGDSYEKGRLNNDKKDLS